MPLHLRHPHMNVRVLTVFALVSLPLLAVGAAVVLGTGQSQLRASYGAQLSQVAEQTAAAVDAYMFRQIIDVSQMARVPTLRDTAASGSAQPFDVDRMQALDYEWRSTGNLPAALADVTTNRAAAFLRDLVLHDTIYREILLTDRHGRLVAASGVSTDYDQSDEDWWKQAYAEGAGRVSLTDVTWDDSARAFAFEIAVPVPSPTNEGEVAGVLKVVADIREMLAFVAGTRPGLTGEATLVRPDGSIVFSRRSYDPKARYFATTLLHERLQAVDKGLPMFQFAFTAVDAEGVRHLIGVAPSQLGMSYPNLAWVVAVSQAEDELFSPVRTQLVYLLLVIAITTVVVLLLALWVSMRLAAPPVEIDMHLVEHPKVARIADEEGTP